MSDSAQRPVSTRPLGEQVVQAARHLRFGPHDSRESRHILDDLDSLVRVAARDHLNGKPIQEGIQILAREYLDRVPYVEGCCTWRG